MKRHRLLAGVLGISLAVSACGSTAMLPSPSVSPASVVPSTAYPSDTPPSVTATPTQDLPPATPTPTLVIADLPRIELSSVDATALCDPSPSQRTIEAGESTIGCFDGLALAVAAVRSVTTEPAARMYLRRPACAATPCSVDELSMADVDVWTTTKALRVHLDSRLETIGLPGDVSDGAWPDAGSTDVPDPARPWLKGAPREVARRDPYPFCGRLEIGMPTAVMRCFRDAVLAGRRAEMIEQVYGTEGGAIIWIYRYDGGDRLVRFQHDTSVGGDGQVHDAWGRSEGGMILGVDSSRWDFEPWYGTDEQF